MKRITQEELDSMIQAHKLWLYDSEEARVDFLGLDLIGLDLRGADLEMADMPETNLEGADLRRANLREADLRWANLAKANLAHADMTRTYLYQTDLDGAILQGTIGGRVIPQKTIPWYVKVFPGGWVSIGCMTHQLDYWLEHYEQIGKGDDIDQTTIEACGKILKSLKENPKPLSH